MTIPTSHEMMPSATVLPEVRAAKFWKTCGKAMMENGAADRPTSRSVRTSHVFIGAGIAPPPLDDAADRIRTDRARVQAVETCAGLQAMCTEQIVRTRSPTGLLAIRRELPLCVPCTSGIIVKGVLNALVRRTTIFVGTRAREYFWCVKTTLELCDAVRSGLAIR